MTTDENAIEQAESLIEEEVVLRLTGAEAAWWANHLEAAGIESSELDDLVHDLASQDGTQANNGGLASQVTFVIDRMGSEEAVEQTLRPLLLKGIATQITDTTDSPHSRFKPETADAVFQSLNPLRQLIEDGDTTPELVEALRLVDTLFEEGRKV